jgi:hypothetical protein
MPAAYGKDAGLTAQIDFSHWHANNCIGKGTSAGTFSQSERDQDNWRTGFGKSLATRELCLTLPEPLQVRP